MSRSHCVALAFVLAGVAAAQAPPPPTPCADLPGFHRLDFWVGSWTVWVGEQQVGVNRIRPILDGCALREEWQGGGGGRGESLFYFLPATGEWKQVWVTDAATGRGGVKEKTLVAELPGGALRFQGSIALPDGGRYGDRTTLSPLPEGRVRQLIEVSTGGEAWRPVFDALYVPGPPAVGAGVPPPRSEEVDRWLATAPGDEAVRSWIGAAGGTPLVEAGGALFLAEGSANAPPRLLGDFNDWEDGDGAMTPIAGSRFFVRRVPLRPDARVEYVITVGGEERLDPFNPSSVDAFGGRVSELRMPDFDAPEPLEVPVPEPRGRLVHFEHQSATLGNRRAVYVYLPAGYDGGERRYPTVYVGDGTSYVERLLLPQRLDQRIARGEIEPLVAVFVDPADRRTEYAMHEGFRRMMTEELLPRIERDYRVEATASRRAIAGASRGALAAFDLALARPDLFGAVVALAPAIEPYPMAELFARPSLPGGRYVVARALFDGRFGPDAAALRVELEKRGGQVVYLEIPEGHSRATWANRFDELLTRLWPSPK